MSGARVRLVKKVLHDGALVQLDDDTLWEVSEIDRVTSLVWPPLANVTIKDERKMINVDDDEVVEVRRVK